jgi:tRNA threonylcarbamoyladenosine modification (KEOPS) complex  Pcc1 subunit
MDSAKAEFELTFDSKEKAGAIYRALKVETDAGPADRAKVLLHLNENILGIDITAMDSASLRACVNTYSRWINMTKSLVEV